MIPGINPEIFDYLEEHYDAVVLESFGVGGVPYYDAYDFEAAIGRWTAKGKVLVVTTQVAHEGSDMEVYAVGQSIKQKLSLIEAFDMTTEAIVTKLIWILGITREPKKIAEMFYAPVEKDILL